MFKLLRRLAGRGYRHRRDFFRIRLFGRKALSFLYGNLSLRNFKYIYLKTKKAQSQSFYTAFFFNLVRRVDVLLSVFKFAPTSAIAQQYVRQGVVFITGPFLLFQQRRPIYTPFYYVKTLEALHVHRVVADRFFVFQFADIVGRRPFFYYRSIA
jgi:ribosomal protein S4